MRPGSGATATITDERLMRSHVRAAEDLRQSHLRKANALRVGLPFLSFIGPGMPPMRAQNDLRLAAALGLFLACFADTGRLMFLPLARRLLRPFSLRPPLGFLPSFLCQASASLAGSP